MLSRLSSGVMWQRWTWLILLPALAMAAPLPSRRAPEVVKTLGSRYQLPTPSPTRPSVGARDLADYVLLQQRHFPGAVVTSGFYDWRTTSRFRSQAGLHLGYDVAMPYGCSFSAGWAGTVVAITPWYGEQCGITVQEPGGRSVTYGHVSPRVNLGQTVRPGDILGTIAYDHVDVKMRDPQGNYLDFGGQARVLPAPTWAGDFAQPQPSREAVMANWLLAQNSLDLAQEELTAEKLEQEKLRLKLENLRLKLPALREGKKVMAEYVEQGLVSRLTVEETQQELTQAEADLSRLSKLNHGPRLQQLNRSLAAARKRLQAAKSLAQSSQVTWREVEAFVQATIANDRALSHSVKVYKAHAAGSNARRLGELSSQLTQAAATLKSYQELFEMGGISRNELQEVKEKHQLLQAQVRALGGTSAKPETSGTQPGQISDPATLLKD